MQYDKLQTPELQLNKSYLEDAIKNKRYGRNKLSSKGATEIIPA